VCRAASSVASVLPRGCWWHEVPLKCKVNAAPPVLNKLPFLSTLLRTWKYTCTVLCNSNTIVFDHTLQIVLGNTKYFTLTLVRVCKALPCRFWGWLPLYTKCQHLENFVVQMSLNNFWCYCDDWGLKAKKTTWSTYTQLHLQSSLCVSASRAYVTYVCSHPLMCTRVWVHSQVNALRSLLDMSK